MHAVLLQQQKHTLQGSTINLSQYAKFYCFIGKIKHYHTCFFFFFTWVFFFLKCPVILFTCQKNMKKFCSYTYFNSVHFQNFLYPPSSKYIAEEFFNQKFLVICMYLYYKRYIKLILGNHCFFGNIQNMYMMCDLLTYTTGTYTTVL